MPSEKPKPARPFRVFLSSTFEDLVDYRARVARAIERLRQQPGRMETFVAEPDTPLEVCRKQVAEADAQDRLIDAESDAEGLEVLAKVRGLKAFKKFLGSRFTPVSFTTPEDLAEKVSSSLARWLIERPPLKVPPAS